MGPYACGMGVAYLHSHWKKVGLPEVLKPLSADALLAERLADRTQLAHRALSLVLGVGWLLLTFYGAMPGLGGLSRLHNPSLAMQTFIYVCSRTLFGCTVAYFILMMLNEHAWPLRTVLSWPVWIPFARLSYSACEFALLTPEHFSRKHRETPRPPRRP